MNVWVTKMSEDCVFCRIVRKTVPASIIYEDDAVVAFLDIKPLSNGHTLIIPKEHYETIFDIPEELLTQVHKVAKHIAAAVKESTKADGISIIQQNGRAANQDIFHLHVHVIPRLEGHKLPHFNNTVNTSREQLDQVAAQIKKELR